MNPNRPKPTRMRFKFPTMAAMTAFADALDAISLPAEKGYDRGLRVWTITTDSRCLQHANDLRTLIYGMEAV